MRNNYVYYRTYRKPPNTYNNVPFDSCHSRATKLGIIATEFVRLLRTNRHENDFEVAQLFSTGRFIERGYPHSELRRLSDKFCWSRKSAHAVKRQQSRVVPFQGSVQWCCTANRHQQDLERTIDFASNRFYGFASHVGLLYLWVKHVPMQIQQVLMSLLFKFG